jgi:hypothetical protein
MLKNKSTARINQAARPAERALGRDMLSLLAVIDLTRFGVANDMKAKLF